MKGKGEPSGWITRNGVHVPIFGSYTVRGGVEPKAKSAKVKGLKKKPDKYTNPRTGKRDHVQGKTQNDLNKSLKEQGLVLDAAYQRSEDDEKVLMYDNDGNVYTGNFNKYSDGGREITHIELDKKAEKVAPGQVEGKKPVTKDEEYKSKLAEADKAFDNGDYKKANAMYKDLKKMQASGEVSDETITGKTKIQRERDEQKSQAKQKAFEANSLVNEGMDKEEARKAASKQESSTPKISDKTKRVADNARKSLMFDKGYAEISPNHWSWAGMSNNKVVAALNETDPKYSYELKTEQTKGLGAAPNVPVNHTRLYRTEKNATMSNAGSRYKTESSAKATNYSDMTVEGLKAAMAGARPGDKAKIRAALRAKGYVFKGGKWIEK